jgi:hypothetical protein
MDEVWIISKRLKIVFDFIDAATKFSSKVIDHMVLLSC